VNELPTEVNATRQRRQFIEFFGRLYGGNAASPTAARVSTPKSSFRQLLRRTSTQRRRNRVLFQAQLLAGRRIRRAALAAQPGARSSRIAEARHAGAAQRSNSSSAFTPKRWASLGSNPDADGKHESYPTLHHAGGTNERGGPDRLGPGQRNDRYRCQRHRRKNVD
jgi:hypothetical protein